MPIREISRRTGLSRYTIRKYLRADIVEPSFETPTRPSRCMRIWYILALTDRMSGFGHSLLEIRSKPKWVVYFRDTFARF